MKPHSLSLSKSLLAGSWRRMASTSFEHFIIEVRHRSLFIPDLGRVVYPGVSTCRTPFCARYIVAILSRFRESASYDLVCDAKYRP